MTISDIPHDPTGSGFPRDAALHVDKQLSAQETRKTNADILSKLSVIGEDVASLKAKVPGATR